MAAEAASAAACSPSPVLGLRGGGGGGGSSAFGLSAAVCALPAGLRPVGVPGLSSAGLVFEALGVVPAFGGGACMPCCKAAVHLALAAHGMLFVALGACLGASGASGTFGSAWSMEAACMPSMEASCMLPAAVVWSRSAAAGSCMPALSTEGEAVTWSRWALAASWVFSTNVSGMAVSSTGASL